MDRAYIPAALAFLLVVGPGCFDREGLDTGGGGKGGADASGKGGGQAGAGGSTGGSGIAGAGGRGGVAGQGGAGGQGGTAGQDGKGGAGGRGGTGGAIMCGPVCAIFCEYGNVKDANGCPTCKCNPPPACTVAECLGPPPYAQQPICTDGKIIPAACTRDSTGKCSWNPPRCESACTTDQCGPGPLTTNYICPDGTVAGPVCAAGTDGACGWTIRSCPANCPTLQCLIACPYGDHKDANGCHTCDCLPADDCGGHGELASCQADTRCTWLAPGCGTPALATQGCYNRSDIGCQSDSACASGRQCLNRVVQPCPGGKCGACALTETVCL